MKPVECWAVHSSKVLLNALQTYELGAELCDLKPSRFQRKSPSTLSVLRNTSLVISLMHRHRLEVPEKSPFVGYSDHKDVRREHQLPIFPYGFLPFSQRQFLSRPKQEKKPTILLHPVQFTEWFTLQLKPRSLPCGADMFKASLLEGNWRSW